MPYGSRGHVLSRAKAGELKDEQRVELPRPVTPPQRTARPEAPTRVSVIQRVPPKVQSVRREETKIEIPRTQEPEQVCNSFNLTPPLSVYISI